MNLKDIQAEYRDFIWYISLAHSLSEDLVRNGNGFLFEYCKSLHCDKKFAEEFEINLLLLEKFYQNLDDLLEMTDKTNLLELNLPKIDNIVKLDKKVYENHNDGIFVDLSKPIIWKDEKDED